MLRGLAANGVEVEALAAHQFFSPEEAVPDDMRVEVLDVRGLEGRGLSAQLRRLYRPRGSLIGPFSQRVLERSRDVDVVHLEETETAWCDLGVTRPSSLNIHFRTLRDRRVPPPWRHEFRFMAEFATAEVVAARRHRFLVANSHRIADSLRRLNRKADVTVVPLALDPAGYSAASLDGPPVAGLIGSGDWPPTANAVHRLIERVWPAVRRAVPDATLRIAGRKTELLAPASGAADGVEFLGAVDSASDFLAGLSVLLYPVERGSGMKVKVLEALASGIPVVTTRDGAEGVDPTDGVLVRSTDEELATAAAELLRDGAARRDRGTAGRRTFVERYTPAPATAPLASLFSRMAER